MTGSKPSLRSVVRKLKDELDEFQETVFYLEDRVAGMDGNTSENVTAMRAVVRHVEKRLKHIERRLEKLESK